MSENNIMSFKKIASETEIMTAFPPPWTLISGAPVFENKRYYSNPEKTRIAGKTKCTPATFKVSYNVWELSYLKVGKVRITHESGEVYDFEAGDTWILEPGFEGTWEIVEDMVKVFVMNAV